MGHGRLRPSSTLLPLRSRRLRRVVGVRGVRSCQASLGNQRNGAWGRPEARGQWHRRLLELLGPRDRRWAGGGDAVACVDVSTCMACPRGDVAPRHVPQGLIGRTPLVRIRSLSEATGCDILGKTEFLNPGGSVKDRVALRILQEALASGALRHGPLHSSVRHLVFGRIATGSHPRPGPQSRRHDHGGHGRQHRRLAGHRRTRRGRAVPRVHAGRRCRGEGAHAHGAGGHGRATPSRIHRAPGPLRQRGKGAGASVSRVTLT